MQKRGNFNFLNKKGTLITRQMLIHLGMLSLLVLVYFLLKSYVTSVEKDTEFQKIFLSRDLALLTNTLYSVPGEVTYVYSFDKLDLSKFNFKFAEISISDDRPIVVIEGDKIPKNYPYARPYPNKDTYLISGANSIKLSKSDSKLTITKNE